MRHPKDMSRRDFLLRAGGAALALPTVSAILAACSKPGPDRAARAPRRATSRSRRSSSPVDPSRSTGPDRRRHPDRGAGRCISTTGPTTSTSGRSPRSRSSSTSRSNRPPSTTWRKASRSWSRGQVKPDVFFPTTGLHLRRLVQTDLLQPLNHELLPNMAATCGPASPTRARGTTRGGSYTVPYTIYTSGVAYRRDRMDDDDLPPRDGTRCGTTITRARSALRLVRRHARHRDPPQREPRCQQRRPRRHRRGASEAILQTIEENQGASRSTACTRSCPRATSPSPRPGPVTSSARSGTCRREPARTCSATGDPTTGSAMIGNDLLVDPHLVRRTRASAHEFLNFFLDEKRGYEQLRELERLPTTVHIRSTPRPLIADNVVPSNLADAVVTEEMFKKDLRPTSSRRRSTRLWLDAWTEIKAGD